jgi:hypothetical protein
MASGPLRQSIGPVGQTPLFGELSELSELSNLSDLSELSELSDLSELSALCKSGHTDWEKLRALAANRY